MTLRELWRMAWVRRREEWDRFCCIVAALSFDKVDPLQLNPIRRAEVERLKTKAFKQRETRSFMLALGVCLGDKKAVETWQSAAKVGADKAGPSTPEKPSLS